MLILQISCALLFDLLYSLVLYIMLKIYIMFSLLFPGILFRICLVAFAPLLFAEDNFYRENMDIFQRFIPIKCLNFTDFMCTFM